jgi:hypothetical protein
MVESSDAERIQRDREHRRALERLRMEEERRDRQLELTRLRLFEPSDVDLPFEENEVASPKLVLVPAAPPPSADRAPSPGPPTESDSHDSGSPRAIGGTLRPPSIAEFLRTDPTERFDIQTLNTLRFPDLLEEARGDPTLLATLARRAEALMVRVKHELDDPLTAGAFLRDQVLRWYRESAEDPGWTARMSGRWAGLFAESRVNGGRLELWLNLRLWSLRERAVRAGPLKQKLRRGLLRDRTAEAAVGRTASQQIHAEVAQAILDDLASHPRDREAPLPLVRLSELGVRRQVPTVNDALASLFSAPETGPFVLLHPNRYPECEETLIRPPAPGATGAALAYSLGPGRPLRKPTGRDRRAGDSIDVGATHEGGGTSGEDAESELDAATIWEAESVAPETWHRVVEEARRARRRLDPPPKDFRTRAAYNALRDLLFEDGDFRKAFLAARWRGRPAGLPLLVSLLQKSTIAPDVSTDHEYLEAELGELVQGDPHWSPSDGRWRVHGWTIIREGSHREGFRFRAERSG